MFYLGKHCRDRTATEAGGDIEGLAPGEFLPRWLRAPVSASEIALTAIVISLIAAAALNSVAAQQRPDDPKRGQGVDDRRKAEFQPLGIRARSFLVFPTVSLKETYDTNIFAKETGEVTDFITEVDAKIRAESNFSRHSLKFNAGVTSGLYASNSAEDFIDYTAGTDARLDVGGDGEVNLRASFARSHEDRSSPDDAGGNAPTELSTGTIAGGVKYKPNRLSLSADMTMASIDYDDVQNGQGAVLDQDDRDRFDTSINSRFGYRFKAENEGFVEARFNFKDYDQATDNSGLNKDNWGYEVRFGTTIELTGLLEGDVFAGYLEQIPDAASLSSFGGVLIGGGLDWHVTPLTTLTGDLSRNVNETTTSASPGFVKTEVTVGLQHELLRNFILRGNFQYGLDDYSGIDRKDDNIKASFNARYLFNRNLFSEFDLGHSRRSTNIDGAGFSATTVSLKLGAQF